MKLKAIPLINAFSGLKRAIIMNAAIVANKLSIMKARILGLPAFPLSIEVVTFQWFLIVTEPTLADVSLHPGRVLFRNPSINRTGDHVCSREIAGTDQELSGYLSSGEKKAFLEKLYPFLLCQRVMRIKPSNGCWS